MNTSPSLNKELVAKEREAFEAWAGSVDSWLPNIKRRYDSYEAATTAAGWHAWQARAASTPSALPVEGAEPITVELSALKTYIDRKNPVHRVEGPWRARELSSALEKAIAILNATTEPGKVAEANRILKDAIVGTPSKEGAGQVEAVAWRDPTNLDPGQSVTFDKHKARRWAHIYSQPLYAHPPASPSEGGGEPLTPAQIDDIARAFYSFVREEGSFTWDEHQEAVRIDYRADVRFIAERVLSLSPSRGEAVDAARTIEACAKVCDDYASVLNSGFAMALGVDMTHAEVAEGCAEAIRKYAAIQSQGGANE